MSESSLPKGFPGAVALHEKRVEHERKNKMVRIIVTVEDEAQANIITEVLAEAEVEGKIDFAFDTKRTIGRAVGPECKHLGCSDCVDGQCICNSCNRELNWKDLARTLKDALEKALRWVPFRDERNESPKVIKYGKSVLGKAEGMGL